MKTLSFSDFPDFKPNLTPREIFELGSFGGTYWRPIYSSVTGKNYKDQHKEFEDMFKGIPENKLSSSRCQLKLNKYGKKSGSSLEMWEEKGWIKNQDPYGWVQWYCRFYQGRRTEDDARQVQRWKNFAGPKGRFRNTLINKIKRADTTYDDYTISPTIRQGLQHWAYQLTEEAMSQK